MHPRTQTNRIIAVGQVIEIWDTDVKVPKFEMHIIVGLNAQKDELGSVFINTFKSHYKDNPEFDDLQYELMMSRNPYLKTDSFADCSKIWCGFTRNFIEGTFRGNVNKTDMDNILALLREASTSKPYYLNYITFNCDTSLIYT